MTYLLASLFEIALALLVGAFIAVGMGGCSFFRELPPRTCYGPDGQTISIPASWGVLRVQDGWRCEGG